MVMKGDWFLEPYQCKKCWFVNVCGKLSRRLSVGDKQTLNVLRRSNLDIFWSWDTATVKGILGYKKEIVRRSREGRRLTQLPEVNAWPVGDEVVTGVAIQMLDKYL